MKKIPREIKRDKTTQMWYASRLSGQAKNAGIKPRKKPKKSR
ncbi:MAG: hypothetical protein AAB659_01955 [Patescibacteria group bacterium]